MDSKVDLERLVLELRDCDEDAREAQCSKLLSSGRRGAFVALLESRLEEADEGEENVRLVAEIVAELGKVDTSRVIFAGRRDVLVKKLVQGIEEASIPTAELCCRAVGNMCHDCDAGREAVLSQNGVAGVGVLLERLLKASTDGVETAAVNSCRRVVVGCLLNLVCDCEAAQIEVVRKGVFPVIKNMILATKAKEDIVVLLLSVISCLSETDTGRKELYENGIVPLGVEILHISRSCNIVGGVIDLIATLVDHEEEKLRIASSGIFECLLETIDVVRDALTSCPSGTRSVTEEDAATWSQEAVSHAGRAVCDIVTLVLSGEGASEALFQSGTGVVYQAAQKWLESEEDTYIVSGCLAIGNFARDDNTAGTICCDGVGEKLLSIVLARNDENDGDREVLASALSAIKNLCVLPANRSILLRQGLLDALAPLLLSFSCSSASSRRLRNDFLYATFVGKTLACCRLSIQIDDDANKSNDTVSSSVDELTNQNCSTDSEAPLALSVVWPVVGRKDVVDSIVGLCEFDGNIAVVNTIRMEARRLLAAIAKNVLRNQASDPAMAKTVLATLLDSGAVSQLQYLVSNYQPPTAILEARTRDILTNESLVALIALTRLLGAGDASRVVGDLLTNGEGSDVTFLEAMEKMMGESQEGEGSTGWRPEVVVNGVVLLETLLNLGGATNMPEETADKLRSALMKAQNHGAEVVRKRASEVSCSSAS